MLSDFFATHPRIATAVLLALLLLVPFGDLLNP